MSRYNPDYDYDSESNDQYDDSLSFHTPSRHDTSALMTPTNKYSGSLATSASSKNRTSMTSIISSGSSTTKKRDAHFQETETLSDETCILDTTWK